MAETKEKKNKKINKMTPQELETAIEKTVKEQGSLNSRYGKELKKRKDFVSSSKN